MSSDDPEDRTGGSVPHTYRNALFWRWVPSMPKPLKGGFLTMLYALAAGANASGRLRFSDGKVIKADVLAKAAGCDVKDARRYLDAAEAAGVVIVEGQRGRGRRTSYALVLSPSPDWSAAVTFLAESKRDRPGRKPEWKKGGPPPEVESPGLGGPLPELQPESAEEKEGAAPSISSGDRPPISSGGRPPNEPGITHEVPQGVVPVGGTTHVARASPPRTTAVQPPMLLPLQGGRDPREVTSPGLAELRQVRASERARLGRETEAS